MLFNLCIDFTI